MDAVKERWNRLIGTNTGRAKLAVFLFLFLLNCLAVQTMDDLGYKISSGALDILYREYVQYMTWTGRTVAHLIARCFLALPKLIFNIANSLCFVRLCSLIVMHARKEKTAGDPFLFLTAALLVFLTVPFFGQTCLWETGSCNYLWTTVIVLEFLLRYRLAEEYEDNQPVLLFLFGIIAGWTNENTGGALILMELYFLFFLFRMKKTKPWMFTGLAGSMLGFLMLIKAPGNSIRAQDFISTNGKAYELVHDMYGVLEVLQDGQKWLWILIAAGLTLCVSYRRNSRDIADVAAYALAGAAAVGAIMLSPVPVLFDRSMFGATILVITGVMICFVKLAEETEMKRVLAALFGVMLVTAAFRGVRTVADLSYTAYQDRAREQYVSRQKEAGNLNPVVPLIYDEFITSYDPLFGLGDLSCYRSLWVNELYAQAHGIESVQATALERWSRIYRDGDPALMNLTDMEEWLAEAVKGERTLLIVTNGIDAQRYAKELGVLRKILPDLPETGRVYVCAAYENGTVVSEKSGDAPCELDGNVNDSYWYLSSQDSGEYSDILVNGIEYTNDCGGVTIAVFDRAADRVTDSVSWDPESDQGGIRFYIEK